ncbi:MAG: replication-relaxation family protein [Terriglobales bacterium]
MRYWKGSIALSSTRDYPLLRQVLHSGFVTHSQLFEFLRLDYCVSSRNTFNNRILRLVRHGLLIRHELPFISREAVYSISEAGASEMAGKGESHARQIDHLKSGNGQDRLHHSLDLNEIHLALKRTGTLVYWTSETEIRSRNDLTTAGYWKYYDAVVVIRLAGQDCRFALEYERTPKATRQYLCVRQRIEQETSIVHFLYLMPNYDLLWFVADKLSECKRAVHFGLLRDFLHLTLALPVRRNGSPVSMTLASVLTHGRVVPKTGTLWENIAV